MDETITGLIAAHKTSQLIGREPELAQIQEAIFAAGTDFRLVFIRGPHEAAERGEPEGGYGKTRLIEEIHRLLSDPQSRWQRRADRPVAVTEPIDLIDIHLHAQSHFVRALSESYHAEVHFPAFEDAYKNYQRQLGQGMEYRLVREAAERAERAFLTDYEKTAGERRLVWLLDTTEQLAILSSEWLLDKGVLTPDDMQTRTLEWLKRQIAAQKLPNTTLICAGRGRGGRRFFDELKTAVKDAYGEAAVGTVVKEVWAEPFTADETREYFRVLAAELAQRPQPEAARLAKDIQYLADNEERSKVVWLYTGGVPVRLALYAQLVAEGRHVPEQLQWSWKRVVNEVGTDSTANTTPALEWAQWQVEEHFINLLFDSRNVADLRYRILLALVRARRGLSAAQLHFVLDNLKGLSPEEWKANPQRVNQIDEQLQQMAGLFLVRSRPTWWRFDEADTTEPQPGAVRHGLQDDIYRLFAEHMSPLYPDPEPNTRLARIRERLEADRARYEQNRRDEQAARRTLYTQLQKWAIFQRDKLQQQRREYQESDERSLRLFAPTEARRLTFPPLGDREREHRNKIQEAIRELDLEAMYYGLLLDPEKGFNEDFFELASRRRFIAAEDEDYEILIQAELWRMLHDEDALRFVDFKPRQVVFDRGETLLQVLRRAVQHDDAVRWVMRFVFRKDYQRAIDFADNIDRAAESLQFGNQQDKKDWRSWNHTFARGQRTCWRSYARILMADNVEEAVSELKQTVDVLVEFTRKTESEIVVPAAESKVGVDEKGFCGVPGNGMQGTASHHPAYRLMRRVISFIYNAMGYGCVNLGQFRKALDYYGRALYYIREVGMLAFRANVLNNQSRLLSDMGRMRAVRVCRDGLEIRKQLGEEVAIAYSHNTLALIFNDRNEPEDAWKEAALAVAYFRRAEEPRGLGLALLQLGEALRRLANRSRYQEASVTEAEQLYSVAEELLTEAHGLFLPLNPDHPEPGRIDLNEPARRIEARIELGCLHRDRIRAASGEGRSPRWPTRYRDALYYLTEAANEAKQLRLKRLEMDARVNIGLTHFYAGKYQEAETVLREIEEEIEQDGIETKRPYLIRPIDKDNLPEGYAPRPAERDNLLIFAQLSKMYGLRGYLALEQFMKRTKEIGEEHPGDEQREHRQHLVAHDEEAKQYLNRAAECYSLGAWYAQLYSPRSSSLTLLYDRLYSYIKKFNGREQDDFYRAVQAQRQRYPVDTISANIEDLGNIEQFLYEVAGLSDEILKLEGGADD